MYSYVCLYVISFFLPIGLRLLFEIVGRPFSTCSTHNGKSGKRNRKEWDFTSSRYSPWNVAMKFVVSRIIISIVWKEFFPLFWVTSSQQIMINQWNWELFGSWCPFCVSYPEDIILCQKKNEKKTVSCMFYLSHTERSRSLIVIFLLVLRLQIVSKEETTLAQN